MNKNKFQLKREETYERMIHAGMRLLCERGYSSATIDDIAHAAGYTKGAFYAHFKNKEEFFFHLLEYRYRSRGNWPDVKDTPGEGIAAGSLRGAVKERMVKLLDYLERSPGWNLVYIEFFLHAKRNIKVKERYRSLLQQWLMEIERFIDSLKSRGWVDAGLLTPRASLEVFALLEGMILHKSLYETPLDPDQAADAVLKLLRNS